MKDITSADNFPQNGVVPEATGPPCLSAREPRQNSFSNDNDRDGRICALLDDDDYIIEGLFTVIDLINSNIIDLGIPVIEKITTIAVLNNDGAVDEISTETLGMILGAIPSYRERVISISKHYLNDECTYVRGRALHAMGQVALSDLTKAPDIRDIAFAMSIHDYDKSIRTDARVVVEDISSALLLNNPKAPNLARIPYFKRIPML